MTMTPTDLVRQLFFDASRNVFDTRFLTSKVVKRASKAVSDLRLTFSDATFELAEAVERGTQVGFTIRIRGTHNSSRRIANWTGTGVARVEAGRVSKLNVRDDKFTRDLQLGNVPRRPLGGVSGRWSGSGGGVYVYLNANQDGNVIWGDLRIQGLGPYDFEGTASDVATGISISGLVADSAQRPVGGVTLTLAGSSEAVLVTDATGRYTFANLAAGSYSVRAAKTGCSFVPDVVNLNNLSTAVTQNFTSSCAGGSFSGDTRNWFGFSSVSIRGTKRFSTQQIEFTGKLVSRRQIRGTLKGLAGTIVLTKGEG